MDTPVKQKKQVPIFCYQCVAGPDLMKVEVEDGIATRIESNYDISEEHPGGGRVCVRAYGLIQKTYNPNRVKGPMKRTNPKKGRHEDPGFVPITWEEALDTVAGKIRTALENNGGVDDSGYPRIAVIRVLRRALVVAERQRSIWGPSRRSWPPSNRSILDTEPGRG